MNKIEYYYEVKEEDLKLNDSFVAAKKIVIDKIFATIKYIEDRFNVSISCLLKNDNTIIFESIGPVDFEISINKNTSDEKLSYIAKSDTNYISFLVYDYAFSLKNKCKFTVEFDSNLNFLTLSILSSRLNKSRTKFSFLSLNFDTNLNCSSIEHIDQDNDYNLSKTVDTLSTYEDELMLFKIYESNRETLINDFPEFYIPAAYDFQSEQFANRIKVFLMLTF